MEITEPSLLHSAIAAFTTVIACSSEMFFCVRGWASKGADAAMMPAPSPTARTAALPTRNFNECCMESLPEFLEENWEASVGQALPGVEGLGPLGPQSGFHLFLKLLERPHLDLAHPFAADLVFDRQVFERDGIIAQAPGF